MLSNLEKPNDNARTNRCEEYRETGNNTSNARLRTAWLPDGMGFGAKTLNGREYTIEAFNDISKF